MGAMTSGSLRQSVTITNPAGLHMRPAQAFVEAASRFQSSVLIAKDGGERVNGKSMLSLLSLAAEQGTLVHIEVAGPDCQDAILALVEVLQRTYTDE
jgi:phosphotransferase system HPr (HPr) family protein